MAVVSAKAVFRGDVQKIWDVVTSVQDYTWRSDLGKTKVVDEKKFIEYTKSGYATNFTITAVEPYRRWEINMENSNIKGHWVGVFIQKDGETEINFIEDVTAKKLFMKPFVKFYLRKQQAQFIADLRKVLQQ